MTIICPTYEKKDWMLEKLLALFIEFFSKKIVNLFYKFERIKPVNNTYAKFFPQIIKTAERI